MSTRWTICTLSVIIVSSLIIAACLRQRRVDQATRLWQRYAGGITDTESPLFGPGEVFIILPEALDAVRFANVRTGIESLYSTCKPSLEIRWKFEEGGLLEQGRDSQVRDVIRLLMGTNVGRVRFLRLDCSDSVLQELARNCPSIKSVNVSDVSESRIELLNKEAGRVVFSSR